jgi:nucleotide-binding universal stress UspA family protein
MTTTTDTAYQSPTHRVVVGVDGSEGSNRALEWAAAEAARRGAILEAHTSYGQGYAFITSQEVHQAMQHLLDEAANHIADLAAGVTFKGVVHEGSAAKFLIEASEGADLLVVGSRGLGGFSGLLLGSVSQQCSLHAHCPIVIVRAPEESKTGEVST